MGVALVHAGWRRIRRRRSRFTAWSPDNISANVVGLALGTAARFWVFRRYVFLEVGPAFPYRDESEQQSLWQRPHPRPLTTTGRPFIQVATPQCRTEPEPSEMARRLRPTLASRLLGRRSRGVAQFDLPQTFARRRRPSPGPLRAQLEAMSADAVLTRNARTGPAVTHEPDSDARIPVVARPWVTRRDQG